MLFRREELLERAHIHVGMMDELACKTRHLSHRIKSDPDSLTDESLLQMLLQYRTDLAKYQEDWEQIQKEIRDYDLLQMG